MLHSITTYENIDQQSWANLLNYSPTASWFQSPAAFELFKSLPEMFDPFVCAVLNDNELKCLCMGYITRTSNPILNYFSKRAIIYGGPILTENTTEDDLDLLLKSINNILSTKAIYSEIRNLNDYSRWHPIFERNHFTFKPHLNFHVDCTDATQMTKRMSRSKVWQAKKAIRNGVTITEPSSPSEIHDFYLLLQHLYRTKIKTPLFPERFFHEFHNQKQGRLFFAKKDGKIIGGMVCPILPNRTMYDMFSVGLNQEYKNLFPNILTTYSAMLFCAENNIPRFDFMGAGIPSQPYGVREFKSQFGGTLVNHGRFLHIFRPTLYKIGTLAIKAKKHLISL